MVKTPSFQCREHEFDPWLGKFRMPPNKAHQKKKKKGEVSRKVVKYRSLWDSV